METWSMATRWIGILVISVGWSGYRWCAQYLSPGAIGASWPTMTSALHRPDDRPSSPAQQLSPMRSTQSRDPPPLPTTPVINGFHNWTETSECRGVTRRCAGQTITKKVKSCASVYQTAACFDATIDEFVRSTPSTFCHPKSQQRPPPPPPYAPPPPSPHSPSVPTVAVQRCSVSHRITIDFPIRLD